MDNKKALIQKVRDVTKELMESHKADRFKEIQDSDIATIEALHDLLLDNHGYSLDFITLKRARELTAKLQAMILQKKPLPDKDNIEYLRGFVDGHGGEEPHDSIPEGFDNINQIWDRIYELKK